MMQAILFDSDGLLVDTERVFFDATRSVFESAGVSLSHKQWARWYIGEGKRSREIAEILGIPRVHFEPMIAERDRLFWAQIDKGVAVFPGVVETLDKLSQVFRLAVVTGASRRHFERVHASTGLGRFFEAIISEDEYEQAKPHPQAYLVAMQRLGLKPEKCLAVEDSPRGARAAIAAGIRCCVIPTYLTDMTLCPAECTVIENITQLLEFLKISK